MSTNETAKHQTAMAQSTGFSALLNKIKSWEQENQGIERPKGMKRPQRIVKAPEPAPGKSL